MAEYSEESMIEEESLCVTSLLSDAGSRADAFLSANTELTRSAVVRLMEAGRITVDGRPVEKKDKLHGGETFVIDLPAPEPSEALPENIPLNIVYEDEDMIVVYKPKGMVVHPAPGNPTGTLVNALLYHCGERLSGIGGVIRPGIVHRIDKDTEGLLVVAKNDTAHGRLAEQIKAHRVQRVYFALVLGNLKEDSGTVDAPIGRHPVDRKRMAVIRDPGARSREAVTHWQVLERFGQFTLLRCELETGRTHQIRVHMASIGHPLLGDSVYGGDKTLFEAKHKKWISGQCLAACELMLTHPTTGQELHFKTELPEAFEVICRLLREGS